MSKWFMDIKIITEIFSKDDGLIWDWRLGSPKKCDHMEMSFDLSGGAFDVLELKNISFE